MQPSSIKFWTFSLKKKLSLLVIIPYVPTILPSLALPFSHPAAPGNH